MDNKLHEWCKQWIKHFPLSTVVLVLFEFIVMLLSSKYQLSTIALDVYNDCDQVTVKYSHFKIYKIMSCSSMLSNGCVYTLWLWLHLTSADSVVDALLYVQR